MRQAIIVLWAALLCTASLGLSASANGAGTIIDQWNEVTPPAAPALKPVTLDKATTALLLLDFSGAQDPSKGPCNTKNKPRCIASLPRMQALLMKAKAAGVYVVYSVAGSGTRNDIATAIAPAADDPVVKSGPDKFVGTDLAKLLSDRKIATVIVTGTASEGAVLDTATHAALQGMNVVIPVDGMSSTDLYAEQYVAWHFAHAPGVSSKTTLTSSDQITF